MTTRWRWPGRKDRTNDRPDPAPLGRGSGGVSNVHADYDHRRHVPDPGSPRALASTASVAITLCYSVGIPHLHVESESEPDGDTYPLSGAGADPQTGTTADPDHHLRDTEADLSDAFAYSLAEAHGYTDPNTHTNPGSLL